MLHLMNNNIIWYFALGTGPAEYHTDVDAVAGLESFRDLKLSGFESFMENFMMTILKCISGCSDCFS